MTEQKQADPVQKKPQTAKTIRTFLWFVLSLALIAPASYLAWQTINQPVGNRVFFDSKPPSDGASFGIVSAEIRDEALMVSVSYSGGCEDHVFDLYVEKQGSEINRSLELHHAPHTDACTTYVIEDLSYNIAQVLAEHDTAPQITFTISGGSGEPKSVTYINQQPRNEIDLRR